LSQSYVMKIAVFVWLVLGNLALPSQIALESLVLPILGTSPSDVINQYESPLTPYGPGHRGIDLGAEVGTEVLAPASGVISFVGQVGFRNTISIDFGSNMSATVEPVCSGLTEGTYVYVGDSIGTVCEPELGYLSHCEITCLHFGTRTEAGYFSPLALIGGLPSSRLVPLGD
jgi:hypothetical protein